MEEGLTTLRAFRFLIPVGSFNNYSRQAVANLREPKKLIFGICQYHYICKVPIV